MSNATSTISPTTPSGAPKPRSRRACSDTIGNDYARSGGSVEGVKGCAICHNEDSYGRGDSVCGHCNRCHGCGSTSTNNGIGPLQAIYFGGKKVAKKLGAGGGSKGDAEAK
ncbi:hypothetical protein LTR37_016461 [Vermiconidia calcicola]|uniref:Uncharacterized protein n=1 Tax=Vermiconidia calcicola TaxID=1690605 RepID=A0ACC3MNU4_9PEZI|nr:hypothetical protein LTR37_016461 [Vermiconidia calcicola]